MTCNGTGLLSTKMVMTAVGLMGTAMSTIYYMGRNLVTRADLEETKAEIKTHVDTRIGHINTRIGDTNERISDISARIADVNKNFNARIDDINGNINNRYSDLATLITMKDRRQNHEGDRA